MCGRYKLSRRKQLVAEYFDAVPDDADWNPRYNIAPTQPVPVVRQHPKEPRRELSLVRWGLIPSWVNDASGAAGMISARSESAATKPAFRDALKLRRCLIPADGFYEWSLKQRRPRRAGTGRPNVGTQLFWLMQEAGLSPPECRLECVMDGGPYSPVYEWLAETVRSLLPRMEALGITNAEAADCDTLAQRLREEAVAKRGVVIAPAMIGAFARKPHSA